MGSTRTDASAAPALPHLPSPLPARALDAVPGVLGRIARERAADYAGRRLPAAEAVAEAAVQRGRRFAAALARPGLGLIAEVKRASPSQGAIRDLDPVDAARAYVAGGAAAVSVLTETRHFGGRLEHLAAVSSAVDAPTLRKDFVVHPAQVVEAGAAGAAAVLLIVAVLGDALAPYLALARSLGLDALVEVHDEEELQRAVSAGADVIGVNNRDLRTLEIDLRLAPSLITLGRSAGAEALWVAESGYARAAELTELRDVADGVLVGSSLARRSDLARAVRELLASAVHDGTAEGPVLDSPA